MTIASSREKALLRRLAPHLVEDLPFVLPRYHGPLRRAALSAGLWIYDAAAGLPRGRMHGHLGADEARQRYPQLDPRRLRGAFLYYDARADDSRLVLHVIKKAADLGALVANYAAVERLAPNEAVVRDRLDGATTTVRARHIVNASGVWCDEVRRLDDPAARPVVRPSKGVHLVFDRGRIGLGTAAILPSPSDGRVVFVVPWGERAVAGTTDTDYRGDLDRPRAEPEDVDYLLRLLNGHLPRARLTRADVISTFAGLRPLLLGGSRPPSRVARDHTVMRSPSGLVTVTGGKLTTYRRMAKDAVDSFSDRPCRTAGIDLFAAPPCEDPLVRAYGTDARLVEDRRPLAGDLPYVWGEVDVAVRREMAVTLPDVLERRTRISQFEERRGMGLAEAVARRMAGPLGWDAARILREIAGYEAALSAG